MDKRLKIISNYILAVEGNDECNFFQALLKHLNIESIQWHQYLKAQEKHPDFFLAPNIVQLIDIGGKDKFKKEFELLAITDGFSNIEKLGLVRDAEDRQAMEAFQSICTVLRNNNLPVPDSMNSITIDNSLKLGVFIMPDNQGTGMLENLCLSTLNGQPIERCIDEFVTCFSQLMLSEESNKFNEAKARVLAYLSTRVPIVNSLGLGAQRGSWDFSHSNFNEIKSYLDKLFN